MTRIVSLLLFGLLVFVSGCDRDAKTPDSEASPTPEQLLRDMKLNEDTPNVLYTYMNEKREFVTVESAGDVPDPFRNDVIVVDLSLPPERRFAATQVVVTDLDEKTEEGYFPLRLEVRGTFEHTLHLKRKWNLNPTRKPLPQINSLNQAAQIVPLDETEDRIILYSASWCSYCKKTRQWLQARNLAFVELDIEKDEQAARELQAKCLMAKIACNGVPVIDWRGSLIQGYDLDTLAAKFGLEAGAAGTDKSEGEDQPKP